MSEYLKTVVRSGQVNTPPGSYRTVKEWARNSFMTERSSVLEIGCSTGFISIELARYTNALCVGVDLDVGSIEKAKGNIDRYISGRVRFEQGDAGALPYIDASFSHVVVGGHLPFVPARLRRQHVVESLRVLRPWGYLLVALYFYHTEPPASLTDAFNAAIGTSLSPEGNKAYWSDLFEGLPVTLEYDAEYEVCPADRERTQQYVDHMSPGTRLHWQKYLDLFNANGRYLGYFVRIYRRIPEEPVLLQVPRGGIYAVRRKSGSDL